MTRLVPLALASMMMLSGPVALAGGTHVAVGHAAVVHAAPAHEARGGGGHSIDHHFRAAVDLSIDDTANDDGDDDDAVVPDAPPDPETSAAAVRVAQLYYGYTRPPPPPTSQISVPVTTPDPTHHPLDPALALAALHAIDVSTCSANGPGGYGHARVTFGADGHPVGLLISAPQGLSKEAAECIQSRFDAVSVAPFDGSPVTVGASFYVK